MTIPGKTVFYVSSIAVAWMDDSGLYAHNLLNQLCIALLVYHLRICGVWRSGKYQRVVGATPYSLTSVPISRLLRRIFPQLFVITLWTGSVVTQGHRVPFLSHMHIPFTSLSLIFGFCRSVADTPLALSRLGAARVTMGNAILLTHDSAHLSARYRNIRSSVSWQLVILLYSFGCSRHTFATARRMRCCGPCCRRRQIAALWYLNGKSQWRSWLVCDKS
jgi:hypothetical protein